MQVRKDCNYSNLERVKAEAVWSDEQQRWRVPELVVQKTKLPPAGEDRSIFLVDILTFSQTIDNSSNDIIAELEGNISI